MRGASALVVSNGRVVVVRLLEYLVSFDSAEMNENSSLSYWVASIMKIPGRRSMLYFLPPQMAREHLIALRLPLETVSAMGSAGVESKR